MTARRVDDHVELDEDEARAGQTGVHVRYILAISVVLALACMGLAITFA
ncbi:MAG: hypothetical protein ABWZ40_06190 [Caulobacterales bacterium]